ncbi:DUF2135 domain-containing protein [Cystobacter fuscus]|uniref:DUF2135 domain-containing protein n=1 Tax=Cystobacter fuscus TaxID=43 RepID=UPI002B2B7915|nr:DUF2135 domain-containing protein [Cystobacter fuscus]
MNARTLLSVLALLLWGATPAWADGAPTVTLATPAGGWTSNRVARITGTISDTSLRVGTLSINGTERPLPLRGGAFDLSLVLSPGMNVIEVSAANGAGVGRAKVSVFAKVPKIDLRVVLSWDTDETDLDLHVVEPSGEESWYGHKETASGGSLDVDVTTGYGPEIYTQANSQTGTYKILVDYFSDHGNAQTEVKVDVLIHEGTDREERHTFRHMLTRTGGKFEVGTFTVKAARVVE